MEKQINRNEIISVLPEDVAAKYTQVENGKIIHTPWGKKYDLRTISLADAAELVEKAGNTHLVEKKSAGNAKEIAGETKPEKK